jgi:hypothetical protein
VSKVETVAIKVEALEVLVAKGVENSKGDKVIKTEKPAPPELKELPTHLKYVF